MCVVEAFLVLNGLVVSVLMRFFVHAVLLCKLSVWPRVTYSAHANLAFPVRFPRWSALLEDKFRTTDRKDRFIWGSGKTGARVVCSLETPL